MKTLTLIIILTLAGCATKAPPTCAGEVRRVNPPSATNTMASTLSCPVGAA